MAKILLTTLPEAKRALYTQLHMSLGWTYQKIWLDLAGRGRGLQSQKVLRKQWEASTPPGEIIGCLWPLGSPMVLAGPEGRTGYGAAG